MTEMRDGELEALHRQELRALGAATGRKYVYYREIEIDPPIRPMVELLNSRWTVTLNSCGGHFAPGTPRFQYPYVHFAVLHRKRTAWRSIFRAMRRELLQHLSDDATLFVQASFVLPETHPDIFIWRFCPYPYPGYSRHFGSSREFRAVLGPFMQRAWNACRAGMQRVRR